uniref:Uncharacterized protein n=1 Tax=Rhizobium meliloti TaxID=382 RepID=I2E229_RHIML|nr:short hypothetical protein [Sinorhizobium meliloti]
MSISGVVTRNSHGEFEACNAGTAFVGKREAAGSLVAD